MEIGEGTLDFFGKPKIVIRKANVHYALHSKNFSVTYRYDSNKMFIKPLCMTLIIFAGYLATIILNRL